MQQANAALAADLSVRDEVLSLLQCRIDELSAGGGRGGSGSAGGGSVGASGSGWAAAWAAGALRDSYAPLSGGGSPETAAAAASGLGLAELSPLSARGSLRGSAAAAELLAAFAGAGGGRQARLSALRAAPRRSHSGGAGSPADSAAVNNGLYVAASAGGASVGNSPGDSAWANNAFFGSAGGGSPPAAALRAVSATPRRRRAGAHPAVPPLRLFERLPAALPDGDAGSPPLVARALAERTPVRAAVGAAWLAAAPDQATPLSSHRLREIDSDSEEDFGSESEAEAAEAEAGVARRLPFVALTAAAPGGSVRAHHSGGELWHPASAHKSLQLSSRLGRSARLSPPGALAAASPLARVFVPEAFREGLGGEQQGLVFAAPAAARSAPAPNGGASGAHRLYAPAARSHNAQFSRAADRVPETVAAALRASASGGPAALRPSAASAAAPAEPAAAAPVEPAAAEPSAADRPRSCFRAMRDAFESGKVPVDVGAVDF